jgi:hypothetical protein
MFTYSIKTLKIQAGHLPSLFSLRLHIIHCFRRHQAERGLAAAGEMLANITILMWFIQGVYLYRCAMKFHTKT